MERTVSRQTHQFHGYARMSTREQCLSPRVQAERIQKKAAELAAADHSLQFVRCRVDEGISANKVPFDKRPEFVKLLLEMQPGDHLIVWRLDRIDRSPFRLIRAVDQLVQNGIVIHSLEEKSGMALDLDTVQGRIMVMVWAIVTDLFTTQLSESTRAALAWRKENGFAYHGRPSYGRRKCRCKGRNGDKGLAYDVWDDREMTQIREIYYRYESGETMRDLGREYYERKEVTANGQPWVKPYSRGKKKRLGILNYDRMSRAYHWYKDLLAEGKEMGYALAGESESNGDEQQDAD